MTTDTSERGLERLIGKALTRRPVRPPLGAERSGDLGKAGEAEVGAVG